MSSVGLVLGAGGVVGQAYHAGVLAVLEHDCGWDPRSADVIVGTSAGSITGTLLRAGVPASELAAWAVQAPLSAEGRVLHDILGTEWPEFEPFRPLEPAPAAGPSRLGACCSSAVRRPLSFRPLVAALSLLAPGRLDIASRLAVLRRGGGAVVARAGPVDLRGPPPGRQAGGLRPAGHARRSRCTWRSPPRARYRATSPRSPSTTTRTSTAVRTRPPTPRSCASATWTS